MKQAIDGAPFVAAGNHQKLPVRFLPNMKNSVAFPFPNQGREIQKSLCFQPFQGAALPQGAIDHQTVCLFLPDALLRFRVKNQ